VHGRVLAVERIFQSAGKKNQPTLSLFFIAENASTALISAAHRA